MNCCSACALMYLFCLTYICYTRRNQRVFKVPYKNTRIVAPQCKLPSSFLQYVTRFILSNTDRRMAACAILYIVYWQTLPIAIRTPSLHQDAFKHIPKMSFEVDSICNMSSDSFRLLQIIKGTTVVFDGTVSTNTDILVSANLV